jgi:NADPH:quinone reductase-like Zn-dependent oxidoreductase
MKAALYSRYGPPEVVHIEDVEKPVPKDNEVLIKVRAASVNPLDWHFMRGEPYLVRLMAGVRKPKDTRLGVDVAGQVEAVGGNVTQFEPGDEVFGSCRGAFAEYACAAESALVMKPDNVTFEQAAAVPVAAYTALQGLRDKGHIQPGQKVLINGAAGGVGTFAVQIAKSFGADVTGVCSGRNVEMVRSIGADQVVDYTRQDFTKSGTRYDLFFDAVGNHSLLACRRVLNPKGIYIPAGGSAGRWMIGPLARAITTLVLSWFVSQQLVPFFVAQPSKADLTLMHELIKAGKVTPVIDRRYSLNELPAAIRYLEAGHARGKVVVTFEDKKKP